MMIILDNSIVFISSIISFFFHWEGFIFISICFSGNINFLFYEYYSLVENEYITVSGFISFADVFFRLLELISYDEDFWFFIIGAFSPIGIYFSYIYFTTFVNEKGLLEYIRQLF